MPTLSARHEDCVKQKKAANSRMQGRLKFAPPMLSRDYITVLDPAEKVTGITGFAFTPIGAALSTAAFREHVIPCSDSTLASSQPPGSVDLTMNAPGYTVRDG